MKSSDFNSPATFFLTVLVGLVLYFLNSCSSDDPQTGGGAENSEGMNYNFAPGPGRSPYRPGGNVP